MIFGPGARSNAGQAGGAAYGKSSPARAVVNAPDQFPSTQKHEPDPYA